MDRQKLARQAEEVGRMANALREILTEAPFSAGLVRAAEEALLIVFTALGDPNVKDEEL